MRTTLNIFLITLSLFLYQERILYEWPYIKISQQNRITKRKNSHHLATTRAFFYQNNVPKQHWTKIVLTTNYIINPLPTNVLDFKSYLETLQKFYPTVSVTNHLIPRIFGCIVFIHIHSHQSRKLNPEAWNVHVWGTSL